jgi:hypothetical protein
MRMNADFGRSNWWAAAEAAPSTAPLAAGDYRTSNGAGANTLLTPQFAGVVNPNGIWTVRVNDCVAPDAGSITAATLTITGASPSRVVSIADVSEGEGDVGTTPFVFGVSISQDPHRALLCRWITRQSPVLRQNRATTCRSLGP